MSGNPWVSPFRSSDTILCELERNEARAYARKYYQKWRTEHEMNIKLIQRVQDLERRLHTDCEIRNELKDELRCQDQEISALYAALSELSPCTFMKLPVEIRKQLCLIWQKGICQNNHTT